MSSYVVHFEWGDIMNDIILEKEDYTYLEWSMIRSSSGTAGSFLKATEKYDGNKIYYKLSNYDSVNGIVGHECVNELIASRLLDVLVIPHLQYRLVYGDVLVNNKKYTTYLCASDSFRQRGESKMTFEDFYQMEKNIEELPLEFAIRQGWEEQIYQMILVDFLILNRDRHGANIEVIADKTGNVRLAPLFDHGLSFMFNCHTLEEIHLYDVMEDRRVQSFVGSRSTKDNMRFLPKDRMVCENKLCEKDRTYIFAGLEGVLEEEHLAKIWDMIYRRWRYYEDLLDL